MKRKRRNSYKFTKKKQSARGILAFILALVSVGAGIATVVVSFQSGGEAGVTVGSAGMLSMFLAIAALVNGIKSLREEESFKIFPVLGTVVSSIALVCWMAVYSLGFYMSY